MRDETPAAERSDDAQAAEVISFGCRLNGYESDLIEAGLRAAKLRDVVVFNTCAVTAEAERQARQAIRKTRRQQPGARIFVTGCAAQINPRAFSEMPEVDRIVANDDKLRPGAFDAEAETATVAAPPPSRRARALVRVQNGCDHRCTFCVIPQGRGPNRSMDTERIIAETAAAARSGHGEVVLTGVDIASYGLDRPDTPRLAAMLRRVLQAVPELPRLRLSSLDCTAVDDELLQLFAEQPRLAPYLHLSLQSGDDLILKRMARRHCRADAVRACARLRQARPDIALGADLIAGFPTETEEMFANSLRLIADCGLVWLHVFPYSPRPGTPAARIPRQVAKEQRRARAAILRRAGEQAAQAFLQQQRGRIIQALAEQDYMARSEHFAPVRLDRRVTPGRLLAARVHGVADGILQATVIS